jgi:hypothetical protein
MARGVTEPSVLDVRHDLDNVGTLGFFLSGTAEIGNDIGSTTTIDFGGFRDQGSATLISDHPAHDSLNNQVIVGGGVPHVANIELGGVVFDHEDLIPPLPGSTNEQVQLSNHGASVYTLTNVTGASSVSFGGADPTTGYDILRLTSSG